MRDFDQELQRIFEHQNFIASLGDDIVCPLDMQAVSRVLLITARKIDTMSADPCKRCPCVRQFRHRQLEPA